jgi:hypothetical protein
MDLGAKYNARNLPDDAHQLLKRSMLNKKWMKGLRQRNSLHQNYTGEYNFRGIENILLSMRNGNIPAFLSGHKRLDFCDDSNIAAGAIQAIEIFIFFISQLI